MEKKIKINKLHIQTLGERIKFFRLRLELSQMELEIKADISSGTISKVEGNLISPNKETILKIANALKMDSKEIAYLFEVNLYKEELNNKSHKSD